MRFDSLSRLPKRLGVRLILWYALFFVLTGVAAALISYRYLAASLRDNRHVIQSKLKELTHLGEQGEVATIEQLAHAEKVKSRRHAVFVRVLNSQQQVIFQSEPRFWGEFDLAAFDRLGPHEGWQYIASNKDGDVLELISVRFKNGLWLQVGKTIEDRKEILVHYRDTMIGVISGMAILGLAGGGFLAFRALRPIRHLTQATQAIVATGRMDARVPESGVGDELDELTGLFNKMLGRIQSLIGTMREALDNAAHDLRTPLTRIRGEAEVALHGACSPDQLRNALASNIEESDRLLALLNSLMDISEAESGSMRLQLEPVRLRRLVEEVADLYQYSAEAAGVTIAVDGLMDVTVTGDATRLRQVLANLLDNAIKYSTSGGKVTIAMARINDRIAVSFKDQGVGIAPAEIAKVWDRLYRGDKSRSQPGLGLGLSLVRAVVHAHGGEVKVASAPGEGSEFSICFPCAHANS